MQLLPGADWLVTAQRLYRVGARKIVIRFWYLPHNLEYCAAVVDLLGHYKYFAARLNEDRDESAMLAITIPDEDIGR